MGNPIIDLIDTNLSKLESLLFLVSIFSLFIMMLLISINATSRYLLKSQLPGAISIIELYLMMTIFWFSASRVQRIEKNIALDLIKNKMSEFHRTVLESSSRLVTFSILLFMLWVTAPIAWERYVNDATIYGAISLPTYISWMILVIGLTVLCLRIAVQVMTGIENLVSLLLNREWGNQWN